MTRFHTAQLAGRWYPEDAAELRQQVDAYIAAAPAVAAAPSGLVVPHAGYIYSGRAAGLAYAALRGSVAARVVIVAPSHHAGFRGAVVLRWAGFETPLGRVQIADDAVARLLRHPAFRDDALPFQQEHALEIQLPFLQCVLPQAAVVPILLGELTASDYMDVAAALRALDDGATVFVISSDFTHYGRRFGYLPFAADAAEPVRAALRALDMGAIDRICAGDAAGFADYVAETGATICGRNPIQAYLTMHARRTSGRLLGYYTSLDVTGDYEHCVSYASIAFPRAM